MDLENIYPNHNFTIIGSSNNSVIYKMISQASTKQPTALKQIQHQSLHHTKQCFHLFNEYEILTSLKPHPNIIKVHSNLTKNHNSFESQPLCKQQNPSETQLPHSCFFEL